MFRQRTPISREACAEIGEIHSIERLILIEAGEDHDLFSGNRIAMRLEALRAASFIMHGSGD